MKKLFLILFLLFSPLAYFQLAQATLTECKPGSGARWDYTGNGSTTAFPYTCRITDADDLEVILTTTAGVATVQTRGTHYTVSGVDAGAGGNVTFTTAPASGDRVSILRKQPKQQQSNYVPNQAFPAESVEKDLDKLVMQVQQIDEVLRRVPKLPKNETLFDVDMDPPGDIGVIPSNTVATLPTLPAPGTVRRVTDGASATDCTTGGGSTIVTYCEYNGTAWVFTGTAGGTPSADSIGTAELDDGADTPLSGEYIRVDTVDQAGIEYRTAAEVLSDLGQNAGTDITADLEEETHATEHQHGGADEIATATPAANAIPKAEADGDLNAGWIGQDQDYDYTGKLLEPIAIASLPAAGTAGRLRFVNDSDDVSPSCDTAGGGTFVLCQDNGTVWEPVAALSSESDTLDTVFDRGKEIDGANSFVNSQRTGVGTDGIAVYVDATDGPTITCFVAGVEGDCDTILKIDTDNVLTIEDVEGGADLLTIDPDAASKYAMYKFPNPSNHGLVSSAEIPLRPFGDCILTTEEIVTDDGFSEWITCADTTGDGFSFDWVVPGRLQAQSSVTLNFIAVDTNATPGGTLGLGCAADFFRPGTDTYAAVTVPVENLTVGAFATQNRSVAGSATITIGGTVAKGAHVKGRCELTSLPTNIADTKIKATIVTEMTGDSLSD